MPCMTVIGDENVPSFFNSSDVIKFHPHFLTLAHTYQNEYPHHWNSAWACHHCLYQVPIWTYNDGQHDVLINYSALLLWSISFIELQINWCDKIQQDNEADLLMKRQRKCWNECRSKTCLKLCPWVLVHPCKCKPYQHQYTIHQYKIYTQRPISWPAWNDRRHWLSTLTLSGGCYF